MWDDFQDDEFGGGGGFSPSPYSRSNNNNNFKRDPEPGLSNNELQALQEIRKLQQELGVQDDFASKTKTQFVADLQRPQSSKTDTLPPFKPSTFSNTQPQSSYPSSSAIGFNPRSGGGGGGYGGGGDSDIFGNNNQAPRNDYLFGGTKNTLQDDSFGSNQGLGGGGAGGVGFNQYNPPAAQNLNSNNINNNDDGGIPTIDLGGSRRRSALRKNTVNNPERPQTSQATKQNNSADNSTLYPQFSATVGGGGIGGLGAGGKQSSSFLDEDDPVGPLNNSDSGFAGGMVESIGSSRIGKTLSERKQQQPISEAVIQQDPIANWDFSKQINNNNNNTNSFGNNNLNDVNKNVTNLSNKQFLEIREKLTSENQERYKKIQGELVEEVKMQNDLIKKNYETQISLIQENYQKELEHQRKLRMDSNTEFKEIMKQEKQRSREHFDQELKNKELQFEREQQLLKTQYQAEIDNVKAQLQSQVKLTNMMEEIRINTDKLNHISNRIDTDSKSNFKDKNFQPNQQQRLLNELQKNLQLQTDILNNQKKRLERLKGQLDLKQRILEEEVAQEKAVLRSEINRMNELQEAFRKMEAQRQKQLNEKSQKLDLEQKNFDHEVGQIKQDYQQKLRALNVEHKVLELSKLEFKEMMGKLDQNTRDKIYELEDARRRIAQLESEALKQMQFAEIQEMEANSLLDENQRKKDELTIEKFKFEKQTIRTQELSQQFHRENQDIQTFKRDFESNQEQLQRKEMELQNAEAQLNNEQAQLILEKQEVSMMQKTVSSMKHDFIKNQLPNQISNLISEIEPLSNQNTTEQFFNRTNQIDPHERPMTSMGNTSNSFSNFVRRPNSSSNMRKETPKPTMANNFVSQTTQPTTGFNLNGFMNQLQTIEESTRANQNYLSQQRENLTFNRTEIDYSNQQQFQTPSDTSQFSRAEFSDFQS